MWIVPTLLLHPINLLFISKDKQFISTFFVPRRNSENFWPSFVVKIRINVPLSDAVANNVPSLLIAIHAILESWAGITDIFSHFLVISPRKTWPWDSYGKAKINLVLLSPLDIPKIPKGLSKVFIIAIVTKLLISKCPSKEKKLQKNEIIEKINKIITDDEKKKSIDVIKQIINEYENNNDYDNDENDDEEEEYDCDEVYDEF